MCVGKLFKALFFRLENPRKSKFSKSGSVLRFQRVKITEIRRVRKCSYFVSDSNKDHKSSFLTKDKTNYKGRNRKIKKNIILDDILLFFLNCVCSSSFQ